MTGIPGIGKSTYIKNNMYDPCFKTVSRDEIRFSMLREGEEHFSHECDVFDTFVREINESLAAGFHTVADATHINKASRLKLLRRIDRRLYERVISICLVGDIDIAIARNEKRKGSRRYVPQEAICRMYEQLTLPTDKEPFDRIIIERIKET